ncbi:peptidase [Streptomyces sp. NBC_01498]|uniref:peptidase n=1 Tax=Streptomyces sp. NBC_01498 TaxID=2975870 RepID=UPI002E7BF425|nr:peptidase [Streptomyces sp. NBC_01498]WTL25683.1 peptidase [Streptomyces sp. NBC_01498]
MKIRRILATAVTAAVTTPVLLLSAGPALADANPSTASSRTQQGAQVRVSIEELEKAAEKARKAYDEAVAAQEAAYVVLKAALSDDAPLAVAAKQARQAAAEAATAKENADKALADARTALAALPETATDEEKAAAEKAVTDAGAGAVSAAEAKAAADEKAAAAGVASDDARVAAAKEYSKVQNATKAALEAKEKADKALADAKEEAEADPDEPECVIESGFTTVVTGLPSKIVAGSTTDFFLRVKNGTKKTLHQVSPFVFFHATDKTGYNVIDGAFRLQWSTAASPKWKSVNDGTVGSLGALKAGARADVKLRLKVDAKAPAGDGLAFVAGDYVNNDESCGGNFPTEYAFELLAAGSAPGDVDDAEPGKSTPTAPNTEPQGGTSATSVDAAGTTGSLASTGSSSVLPQLAAAAGAAVVLGAGAVVLGRRRKADSTS